MAEVSKTCVIIESPFHGKDIFAHRTNLDYLQDCIRDSAYRGEAPYASHRMMPGALNESLPEERALGLACGYAWWDKADLIVFYEDLGWSAGMLAARDRAERIGKPYIVRRIDENLSNRSTV